MNLTDMIFEMVLKLVRKYKKDGYEEDEFMFIETFKDLLFNMIKALHILQLPEYKLELKEVLPTDEWIREHIETLLNEEEEECRCKSL